MVKKIEGGYTPREFVRSKMMDALRGMHTIVGRGDHYGGVSFTDAQRREVVKWTAKEHNRLLDRTPSIDGTQLEEAPAHV
jgi:hypothetical protein